MSSLDRSSTEFVGRITRRVRGRLWIGLGLGLSLVGAVVPRAGAKVWVDSESGRGATFCFTFPGPSKAFIPIV